MKNILVMEDEPEMRRTLTTILRLEKLHPLAAENGRLGVNLAKKEKPDLILCDVMMPELDGHGVLQALRDDPETASIPFIFLTAKGEKIDVRSGMNLGAYDYLTKPVAKADLLNAINSRLQRDAQQAKPEFNPDFSLAKPLETVLGLTPRAAETLLWIAQGKTNAGITATPVRRQRNYVTSSRAEVGRVTPCAPSGRSMAGDGAHGVTRTAMLRHLFVTALVISGAAVKKHVLEIFRALNVETRTAAGLRALEVLNSPAARRTP
jgi:DNA-binding response OmpR family regulator